MATVKHASVTYSTEQGQFFLNMVSPGIPADTWVLNLPPRLRAYQNEIEALLGKVFAGRPRSEDNLELAQQMTLNWCISKCKKIGINLDESLN